MAESKTDRVAEAKAFLSMVLAESKAVRSAKAAQVTAGMLKRIDERLDRIEQLLKTTIDHQHADRRYWEQTFGQSMRRKDEAVQ